MVSDNEEGEVLQWLISTDPSPLHNRAQQQHEPGTCDWMLRSSEWGDWLATNIRCLWIHGIPGAGKTVLASHLVKKAHEYCEELSKRNCISEYYYCYHGHNQNEAAPFLRWLISRLLCHNNGFISPKIYDLFRRRLEPTLAELLDALHACFSCLVSVYVIVDAIDESRDRDDLLQILQALATDPRFRVFQLLATSREYADIEDVMGNISTSVSMNHPLATDDIRCYVRSALRRKRFKKWPKTILKEVEEILPAKAEGMYVDEMSYRKKAAD